MCIDRNHCPKSCPEQKQKHIDAAFQIECSDSGPFINVDSF